MLSNWISLSFLFVSCSLSQSGVHSEGNSSPFVKYVMDKSGARKVIKSLTLALLKERQRWRKGNIKH